MIGLFNSSKLITNPNPGTSVFPGGTVGVFGAVAGWLCCDGKGDWLTVSVFVPADVLDGCDAALGVVTSVVVTVWVISGAGEGGTSKTGGCVAAFNGFTGLTGLTGLVTFVGLLIDFTQLFAVSIQDPASGCP